MNKIPIPDVKNVLIVASGKGGVGKTTVTVNLALALQKMGAKVGIFDADVYGPNVPLMLGIRRRKKGKGYITLARSNNLIPYIDPVKRFNLKVMSIGLLVSESQVIDPARSPDAVGQLVVQTMRDVKWGGLDYLLIDMPPSAGQPQTAVVRNIPVEGVLIVTTPQDMSLLDASRSLRMYQEADVPVIGVIENMSYFICPNCDEPHEIFQNNKQWRPDVLEDAPILSRIPLSVEISKGINLAHPLMLDQPVGPHAQAFLEITAVLQQKFAP